jgi:hypothetical protein
MIMSAMDTPPRLTGGIVIRLSSIFSVLDGGDWANCYPCRLTRAEVAPGCHLILCWVKHRAGRNVLET